MRVSKHIEEQLLKLKDDTVNGNLNHFYDPKDKVAFVNFVEKYTNKIINNENIDQSLFVDLINGYYFNQGFIRNVFEIKNKLSNEIWFIDHSLSNLIFSKNKIPKDLYMFVSYIIYNLINTYDKNALDKLIPFLNGKGFHIKEIIEITFSTGFDFYNYQIEDNQVKSKSIKGFGLYLLTPIKAGMFSIFKKEENNHLSTLVRAFIDDKIHPYKPRVNIFIFVNENDPKQLEGYFNNFFIFKNHHSGETMIDFSILDYINKNHFQRYENNLADVLNNNSIQVALKYQIACCLSDHNKEKYLQQTIQIGIQYIEYKKKELQNYKYYYFQPEVIANERERFLLVDIFEKLIQQNKEEAYNIILEYAKEVKCLQIPILNFIEKEFKQNALPILILAIDENKVTGEVDYYNNIFTLIKKYDFTNYKKEVFEFINRNTNKKIIKIAASALASLNEKIIPEAKALLTGKTIQQRTVGALILSQISNNEIEQLLKEVVNTEKNDDTRDIIIENLQEQLYSKVFTVEDCKNLIAIAAQRGKLTKLNDKFIDETVLPNLYWVDNTALTLEEKIFLLYRMSRSKGLNSDIEARKVIQCIDKNTSGTFSKYILKCFTDSDSNTKFKYYISLSAMLGGNESIAQLNTLFRNAITDKRVKLAEMIVSGLAMVGTNKALLSVEAISRKFANKKPAISAAANAALEAAAEELNITKEELADRIIPTFEFDGIFKEFELEGATYRAFVDKDFTLCYYDENNKMRKSFPKNITKELKTEFAEINKEIKNVVKSQTGRLENYLMENRKWTVQDWQTYFLNHPIMIVYATQILWIVYDANDHLKQTILCQEDGSIINIDDEEIELEDGDRIGLYHPIFVSVEENEKWNSKLYDKNFSTIFPQTNRKIFTPLEEELDKSVSDRFNNKEIPKGADYTKNFMEKAGWLRTSGDGGSAEFSKKFDNIGLTICPYIEGPAVYYQEGVTKAIIHQINFQGKNWNEKFLIKDVPPVIYSEVMACFDTLISTL